MPGLFLLGSEPLNQFRRIGPGTNSCKWPRDAPSPLDYRGPSPGWADAPTQQGWPEVSGSPPGVVPATPLDGITVGIGGDGEPQIMLRGLDVN